MKKEEKKRCSHPKYLGLFWNFSSILWGLYQAIKSHKSKLFNKLCQGLGNVYRHVIIYNVIGIFEISKHNLKIRAVVHSPEGVTSTVVYTYLVTYSLWSAMHELSLLLN